MGVCEGKGKGMIMILIFTALRMARVDEGSYCLPATHTFIHEWNEPSCHSASPHFRGYSRHAEGRRLSWPGWLVTYRRRSPIAVPTDR